MTQLRIYSYRAGGHAAGALMLLSVHAFFYGLFFGRGTVTVGALLVLALTLAALRVLNSALRDDHAAHAAHANDPGGPE